ncbi:polysaccharide deacetylase family protein [Maribacter sp. IgM3_T14_3]|uniref:polysaccharide deacetylase family protein n=1 Tax=Maribacter sp. IgM3_T14_3 TaxID=3415140 RepID=UPI003C6FC997
MNRVINFHDVQDKVWFEKTIIYLKGKYNLIDADKLYEYYVEHKNLKNACHITIDDGDRLFYDVMFPILKKHKIPATIFISPKIIMEEKNFWFQEIEDFDFVLLTKIIAQQLECDNELFQNYKVQTILKNCKIEKIWSIINEYKKENEVCSVKKFNINLEELLEIDRNELITIGAHTQNHPILANETDQASYLEISESIQNLEQILKHKITNFAYPNGISNIDFGTREMQFLKQNNIKLGFSSTISNLKKSDNTMAIPRIGISDGDKLYLKFKLLLGKKWAFLKKIKSSNEEYNRNAIKLKIANK